MPIRRHRFALAISMTAGLCLGPFAFAADLPVRAPAYKAHPMAPAYNWAGWYVGGNVILEIPNRKRCRRLRCIGA